MYPDAVDICNCGADFGEEPPQVELLARDGLQEGGLEWQMQTYGASLYWHLATTPGEEGASDPDMLRDKDVLEVACGRGGGARYLAEVAKPRSYMATDIDEEEIELCRQRRGSDARPPLENLSYEVVGASNLAERFPAESFDAVLCVQSVAVFKDPGAFVAAAARVLRPGGRLILCDLLSAQALQAIVESTGESGLVTSVQDLSEAVNKVGLCMVSAERCYAHVVARKPID